MKSLTRFQPIRFLSSRTPWTVSHDARRKAKQRWCLMYRTPGMPASAFEYYPTKAEAIEHAPTGVSY